MTSSNFFDLRIRATRGGLFAGRRDALELPWAEPELLPIDAEEAFAVAVERSATDLKLRLTLGNEVIAEVPPGAKFFETASQPWLRTEFGESRLALEQEDPDEPEQYEALWEVPLAVTPRPEVARDFRVMIEDVAQVHEGLAHDVVNRSFVKKRYQAGEVSRLHPEAVLANLRGIYERLEPAVAQIARQPSVMLDRSVRLSRYRGGDRIDAAAAAFVGRDPETCFDRSGRITALGKVRVRVPALSEDLPEHRHIAEGLRRLADRAAGLARHCERGADLLKAEEARWSSARGNTLSVFAQRDLPRVSALEEMAGRARSVAADFQGLLQRHRFLREAGPPRSALGPTPAFLGRSAYREVYRLLVKARQPLGVLVDGDAVRLAYRNLATLYEYWCFLRTILHLRERLGPPRSGESFTLIDDIYRPELAPGQAFHFDLKDGQTVTATYEPAIKPWRSAQRDGDRYGASLTRDPLRPDVTIELRKGNGPGTVLVLDAKSTDLFSPAKFRDMADYSRQIFEPRTGRQPVRQVFLLHRDRRASPTSNIPFYLTGRPVPADVVILGAVPCIPERVNHTPEGLAQVIDRFLETYAPV